MARQKEASRAGDAGTEAGHGGELAAATPSAVPSKGIANLGNTCFFNSVLQNLVRTEPLRSRVQRGDDDAAAGAAAEAVAGGSDDEGAADAGPLTDELAAFFKTMCAAARDGKKKAPQPVRPKDLFEELIRQNPVLRALHLLVHGGIPVPCAALPRARWFAAPRSVMKSNVMPRETQQQRTAFKHIPGEGLSMADDVSATGKSLTHTHTHTHTHTALQGIPTARRARAADDDARYSPHGRVHATQDPGRVCYRFLDGGGSLSLRACRPHPASACVHTSAQLGYA